SKRRRPRSRRRCKPGGGGDVGRLRPNSGEVPRYVTGMIDPTNAERQARWGDRQQQRMQKLKARHLLVATLAAAFVAAPLAPALAESIPTVKRPEGLPAVYTEYKLRPIILIVPRGSGEEAIAARKREADGLRTRFQDCDEGIRLARELGDVALLDPIIRTSEDLNAQQREFLDNTPEGHLTSPETTRQGIYLDPLCTKRA